jgi:hypothetical protein
MESTEKQAVLILADISGYTRFMVENQMTAVHGQMMISYLIETILAEVDIPLTLHGIEGDAVFLSVPHPGNDDGWRDDLTKVRTKLLRFFEVFLAGIVRAEDTAICECGSCHNIEQLRLKIIVHSGKAVYYRIAGLNQVAGTDVILAHRLLKNSVPSREYLLMTDAAYADFGHAMSLEFEPGEEECEGLGRVKTWVHRMDTDRDRARDAMYAQPDTVLVAEARRQAKADFVSSFRAIAAELRRPTVQTSWPSRIGFALQAAATSPLFLLAGFRKMPAQLLEKKRQRAALDRPGT